MVHLAGGQRLPIARRMHFLIAVAVVVVLLGRQLWSSSALKLSRQGHLQPHSSQLRSSASVAEYRTSYDDRFEEPHGSLDVPVCRYPTNCRVVLSRRNQFAVVPSSMTSQLPTLGLNLTVPPPNATTFIFVIEDGCAMGHLLKDVGVVLHIVKWMRQRRYGGRRRSQQEQRVDTLYLVFSNSCASRDAWQRAAGNGGIGVVRGEPTKDLFGSVLAQWWACLLNMVSHQQVRNQQRDDEWSEPLIEVVFHDEVAAHQRGAWAREAAEGTVWLLRRPLHWRWFHGQADAATFRKFALGHCFIDAGPSPPRPPVALSVKQSTAPFVVTVVKRRGNRNFREDDVGRLAEATLSSWPQQHRAGSASPAVVVRVVVLETMPYAEQARLFASTNVLIGAHGAALATIAFMDPRDSIAVELFPFGFGYWLYQELAEAAGITYQAVHGERVSSACHRKCPAATAGALSPHRDEDLYAVLRRWNGHSACKNCDVMWCSPPDDAALTAAAVLLTGEGATGRRLSETTVNETACLHRRVSIVLHNAIRLVLLKKVRSGSFIHPVDSVAWLDRRS